jgi:predicted dienelactone hydrolase
MRTIILAMAACLLAPAASSASYEPMELPTAEIHSLTMDVTDASRQQTIPIRAYLPPNPSAAPLILFSHGLGGSRDNNPYLGKHWAARGFLVVFVQHPGSDENVWKNAGPGRLQALRDAASPKNYISRTKDIPAVLDQLERWNHQPGHPLHARIDPQHIGMSGHSFGAQTTQAMAGQQAPRLGIEVREKRIDAALILSPSPPSRGDTEAAFSSIRIPCLLMTGTRDDNPITHADPATRLKVFPHLRAAPAWQVVFDGALHSDFGQRSTARSGLTRYHQAILALSTAFWDATLRDDAAAAAWLTGPAARRALATEDVWQMNDRALTWNP